MAYDGIMMNTIINQLNTVLVKGRINKIYQVSKYELLFHIRTNKTNVKWLISCHPVYARMQLTHLDYPTPASPNTLTMLLRKHLEGAYIVSFEQYQLDRIAKVTFSARNDFGDIVNYIAYIEIMGKHSNFILCDHQLKIIDCLKRISPSLNSVRTLQPGASYILPPIFDNKLNPIKDDYILTNNFNKSYQGISPILSKEILYRMDNGQSFKDIIQEIQHSEHLYIHSFEGKDYDHLIELTHLKSSYKRYPINEGLDHHYASIDEKERIKQQTSDLFHFIKNEIEKNKNKLNKLESTLFDSQNSDEYRIKGDLLFASLHLIEKGMSQITVDNYYDGTKMTIELDVRFDGKTNAKRYYNKYQKAKNSLRILEEQINSTIEEIEYFESLDVLLSNASYYDALEIKEELENLGYIRRKKSSFKKKTKHPAFETYLTKDNIPIYIGKNNIQNDYLTFKHAASYDMWFHAKDMPGSHVVVSSKNLDEYTIRLAAKIAAYYSKGKNSSSVPVNYAPVKSLKKPPASKPGKVILTNYKTIYIDPDDTFKDEIKKQ